MPPSPCLAAALEGRQRGWSMLALCPPDHSGNLPPNHLKNCTSQGKAPPWPWKTYQERLPTDNEIKVYFSRNPACNVGMALGPVSGLIGLDVDGEGGEELFKLLAQGDATETLQFTTGHGRRLLYQWPAEIPVVNGEYKLGEGELRILGKGRQTVMPPSIHPNGQEYAWVDGCRPTEIEAAPCPAWLIEVLKQLLQVEKDCQEGDTSAVDAATAGPVTHAETPSGSPLAGGLSVEDRARAYLAQCDPAVSGQGGHNQTFKIACKVVKGFELDVETAFALLWTEYNPRCEPPWSEKELRHKVESAVKAPGPTGYMLQDGPSPSSPAAAGLSPQKTPMVAAMPPVPKPEPAAWEAPVPLMQAPAVDLFPLEVLPAQLAGLVVEASTAMCCPHDYLALPLLVNAGAAIGSSRALRVKENYSERPCLYGAVVGPTGSTKSPALNLISEPVYDEESRRRRLHRTALVMWEDNGGKSADKPTLESVFVGDITRERLARKLMEAPRGLAAIWDELDGWVAGMNQYKPGGRGSDRQFYLSVWSGSAISVEREKTKDEPITVRYPFLNVCGCIPPDVLRRMREAEVADGFLDRILFSYPAEPPAAGENWMSIQEDYLKAWKDALSALWALSMEKTEDGSWRPHYVTLTAEARTVWKQFADQLADERNADDFPGHMQGAWSKLKGYGARLALILHYLRWACHETDGQDVDSESMARADLLVEYFKSHAKKVYAVMVQKPDYLLAEKCLDRIKLNEWSDFSKRDLHRDTDRNFSTAEDIDRAIEILEQHGFIRQKWDGARKFGAGRKSSPTYEVNPKL